MIIWAVAGCIALYVFWGRGRYFVDPDRSLRAILRRAIQLAVVLALGAGLAWWASGEPMIAFSVF